jgi:enoyl-CoA hydratase/carnithine racemase
MSYQTLLIEKAAGVAVVTLNRPDKKNAMNPQLHEGRRSRIKETPND